MRPYATNLRPHDASGLFKFVVPGTPTSVVPRPGGRQGRKQAFSRLRAFPRLNAEARRAEAVVAKRLAQRFVAGVRHTSCTEMHYSPRNKPKRDPSPSSVFLCSALPLPFLLSSPPPGARPARANGGRSGWHRDLPANEPGTPVAFKLAKSADGLYYTPLLAESSSVRAARRPC